MPTAAEYALTTSINRRMDRVYAQVHLVRDDVTNSEYDGARAQLEILRRKVEELDEILLAAALDR